MNSLNTCDCPPLLLLLTFILKVIFCVMSNICHQLSAPLILLSGLMSCLQLVAALKLPSQPYRVVASRQEADVCLNCQYRAIAKPVLTKFCTKSITAHLKRRVKRGYGPSECIKLKGLTTKDQPVPSSGCVCRVLKDYGVSHLPRE